jgi:serine/threonine protein kinase/Tfp pilus assembly protein PilF
MSPLPVIGTSIIHYEIQRKLGSGGMGDVYLAEDRNLRRPVALKILPKEFASDAQRKQRFMQEAHAASILGHPNISVIHEIGEADGLLYISMEYVEGETLADRLKRGPLSTTTEIVDIGVQIADAIDAAHAKGITHRDLKPANVMITPRGHVKVLDFGLAKLRGDDRPLTDEVSTAALSTPGMIMGTVPYMSPEQALGRSVDHRTDIFSLGVILYEMTTGRLPFSGQTSAERIANIAHVTPEPPRAGALDPIIRKCLEKDPANRYQTARELEADLRKANVAPALSRRSMIIAAIVAITIATVWLARWKLTQHTDVDSLAVLPFVNGTHDPSIDYLSDGISDTLINNLSQLPKLRVMARSTTFHYKGQTADPRKVGKELGVTAILAGDVVSRGNSLNIRAELIRSSDGSQIWGSQYSGQTSDAASFQQRLSADVIRVIRGRLEGGEQAAKMSKRGTVDPEAYQLYLKGQYARNRLTHQSILTAAQLFQQAIERDPNFALAHVGLADTYLNFEVYTGASPMENLPKARAAAMKALQIDDTMGEAYASLAMIQFNYWEWEEAEKNFKRSIALNSNYAQAHEWYATYLTTMSRLPEALQQIKIAQQLDPLSPVINSNAAAFKIYDGQIDAGMADLKRLVEIEPNMPLAHQWLAFGYLRKKQYNDAIAEVKKDIETSGNTTLAFANAAFIYHVAGRQDEARAAAEEVISRVGFTPPAEMAAAYISIGEHDKAFQWLERGFIDHSGTMTYITWPPWFDEVYQDPRFVSLLKRMGLKRYNAG